MALSFGKYSKTLSPTRRVSAQVLYGSSAMFFSVNSNSRDYPGHRVFALLCFRTVTPETSLWREFGSSLKQLKWDPEKRLGVETKGRGAADLITRQLQKNRIHQNMD